MADSDQVLGTVGITQRWKEFVSGVHARLMGSVLYGITTGSAEQALQTSTGGFLRTQTQASTAKIGALQPSTEIIGYIKIDQTTPGASNAVTVTSTGGTTLLSTSAPGAVKLMTSTESIGLLSASTAKIGALQTSTEVIGLLAASTAKIGALQPSTELIGTVDLTSGNAHIGQTGGNTVLISVNLAPTTSAAYAANDLIGGQISISNAFRSTAVMSGLLQSITLADKTTMQASIDFAFFHTNTSGTTYTNDSALTLADGDIGKAIGSVALSNSDYIAFADNSLATVRGIGLPITATTGTTLYAVGINRSTGPQYASTGDLILTLGILQD